MVDLTLDQSHVIEALLNGIGLGIVVTDMSGKVLLFNNAASDILGVGSDQTKPEDFTRTYGIYLPDGTTICPDALSPLLRAIRGDQDDNLEFIVVTPGRTSLRRWCSINLRPLKNANGEIEGAVLVIQDITERKKLTDEAARSNEALQQFASVAAHDLQEPLRSVTGFLDLFVQHLGENLDEQSAHYIERVNMAVKRMRTLINDLLEYARIQTKPQVLTLVDCNRLVETCIESLASSIDKSSAKLFYDPLPTVMADSSHLSQLFQNLLGNALKYSAKDRAPIVHVSAKKRIAEWLFSIKDNGIGIDMQFAERIFGPFQRLHSTEVYSGTGIGLAICKRIVDRHQGRIWIESVLDQGSTVYFTIPDYSHTEDTL